MKENNRNFRELYTYLIQQIEKEDAYFVYDRNEGMRWVVRSGANPANYLLNTLTRCAYELVDETGRVTGFTADDIDFGSVDTMEHSRNARYLLAPYYWGVEYFENGVAPIVWTLYPDGRYFADSDGYGADDHDETKVYAFIDTNARILVSFRDMPNEETRKRYRELALRQKRSK